MTFRIPFRVTQYKRYPVNVIGRTAIFGDSTKWLDPDDHAFIEQIKTTGRLGCGSYSDLFFDHDPRPITMRQAEEKSRAADRAGSPFFGDASVDWTQKWENEEAAYKLRIATKRAVRSRKREIDEAMAASMAEEHRRYAQEQAERRVRQIKSDIEWMQAAPKPTPWKRRGRFYKPDWSPLERRPHLESIIQRGRTQPEHIADAREAAREREQQRREHRQWFEKQRERQEQEARELVRQAHERWKQAQQSGDEQRAQESFRQMRTEWERHQQLVGSAAELGKRGFKEVDYSDGKRAMEALQYNTIRKKIVDGIRGTGGRMFRVRDLIGDIPYDERIVETVLQDLQREGGAVYRAA